MKQLLLLSVISLVLFSCGKDDSVIPNEDICKMTFYSQNRTIPSVSNQSYNYTHYEDSIVGIYDYGTGTRSYNYYFNGDETITISVKELPDNSLVSYGTYYLDQQGYIDSFVRRNGITDEVDYRSSITRDSENRVIREISNYITYGHDRRFFYDENGDYSYGIEIGMGTQTYNDTIIYTLDMAKPNNGSALYMLDDLNGKRSAHHVIRKQYLNRATLEIRRESRFTIGPLDSDGNVTTITYDSDNPANGVFSPDYSYVRTYSYNCQ